MRYQAKRSSSPKQTRLFIASLCTLLTFSIVNHKTQCTRGDPPVGSCTARTPWLKFIIYIPPQARRWIEYLIMPSAAPAEKRVFECRLIPLLSSWVYLRARWCRGLRSGVAFHFIYLSLCVVKLRIGSAIIARRLYTLRVWRLNIYFLPRRLQWRTILHTRQTPSRSPDRRRYFKRSGEKLSLRIMAF